MKWSEAISEYINIAALQSITVNDALKKQIVQLMDLTSLNSNDTESSIAALTEKVNTPYGHVAALCVMPQFVRQVAAEFNNTPIKIATVANFPKGDASLDVTLVEIGRALADGANEIDVVFPYHRYLAGDRDYAETFVESCKIACGEDAKLKVILETGALSDIAIIADACFDAIAGGADFIKTSTGKISTGATLEAAAALLLVIKQNDENTKRLIGFKVAGGIKTLVQAGQYIQLAEAILGKAYLTPEYFRIGASRLIEEIS